MTKYILNSGGLKNHLEKTKRFHKEVVQGLGNSPRILFCCFAAPREHWEKKFLDHSREFLQSMDDEIHPEFEFAFPDTFEEQLKRNDAVIICDGDDHLLLSYLRNYSLPAIWKNKVVVGSSAGSDALVTAFWTCDWRQIKKGLGILPIKFISHYKSEYGKDDPRGPIDWDAAYTELQDYEDDLPIHALEEGDYIVIEA